MRARLRQIWCTLLGKALVFGVFAPSVAGADQHAIGAPGQCTQATDSPGAAARALGKAIARMTRDELIARQREINAGYHPDAKDRVCRSIWGNNQARSEKHRRDAAEINRQHGNHPYTLAELYFFLDCGDHMYRMSPLQYLSGNPNYDQHKYVMHGPMKSLLLEARHLLHINDPIQNESFYANIREGKKRNQKGGYNSMTNLYFSIEKFVDDISPSSDTTGAGGFGPFAHAAQWSDWESVATHRVGGCDVLRLDYRRSDTNASWPTHVQWRASNLGQAAVLDVSFTKRAYTDASGLRQDHGQSPHSQHCKTVLEPGDWCFPTVDNLPRTSDPVRFEACVVGVVEGTDEPIEFCTSSSSP